VADQELEAQIDAVAVLKDPVRRALYLSRNLAAIRLGMELGERSVIAAAHRFGISTPLPPYPSLYIGSADVYPLEMIGAYTAFANLGTRTAPFGILRVENARGEVLWSPAPARAQVMSREESWLVVDMMKDVVRRGTAYRSVWGAGFRVPAAGKTGTTNDGADVWFIGYTPDLVAGVWMGMDRPQKIKGNAQGGDLAAPAWTAFMTEVYRRRAAPPDWSRPDGIVSREVDRATGLLANPFFCAGEETYTEYYVAGTEPLQDCTAASPFYLGSDSTGMAPANGIPVDARQPAPQPPAARPQPAPRDTSNPFRLPP